MRDLESAGDTGFGDAVRRLAGDIPAVKLDFAFVAVKSGDQVVYGGFAGTVWSGNAEDLPFLHLKTQIVDRFQRAEALRDIAGLEHRKPPRRLPGRLQGQKIRDRIQYKGLIVNLNVICQGLCRTIFPKPADGTAKRARRSPA